ncbi:hypothetical protein PRZ48_002770 [Zasmidium cellare]|uniref:Magnesium transporter n=1 Tax=Zasmidium cellare TaxID=395010 RepID=A0ABR0EUP4_ZASCE|nr:hypothetical protein PRZ48_002770 [Zasmidium cellare]
MVIEDKYIGLALAVTSTLGIGASFVITKKGLNAAAERHGFEGDGFAYLRNPVWWAGIITMVVGEICNFSAYAFAPAILVTPLGALSFLTYCTIVTAFAVVMIYKIAPIYGKRNPMIYLSICSSVGSISIMAIKGFGIAVKLTLGGNNQFSHPSTYVFGIVVVVCILTQMNYFNKALSQFSTNIVNPLYYVTFTTCTIVASFILFRGFNTTDPINTISLLCGFLTIFTGVYLLNLSREDPDGGHLGIRQGDDSLGEYHEVDGIPTDGLTGLQTRLSMNARRSGEEHRRSESWSLRSPVTGRWNENPGAQGRRSRDVSAQNLMHSYDVEANSLHHLVEDDDDYDEDDESGGSSNQKRTSFDDGTGRRVTMNGNANSESSSFGPPRRSRTVDSQTVDASKGKGFEGKKAKR